MSINKQDIVNIFFQLIIKNVRDSSISQIFSVVDGLVKAPSLIKLHNEMKNFTEEDKKTIKKLVLESIDHTIGNFFWTLEQNEDIFDLIALSENKENSFSIIEYSDGLCGDYFSFVENLSKYDQTEF